MKNSIRYTLGTIPKKLNIEFRISFDSNERFTSGERAYVNEQGDTYTTLRLFPTIQLSIFRPNSISDDGTFQRAEFDPEYNLLMTRYAFPIFMKNIHELMNDFVIPEMFHFVGKRLEVDDKLQKQKTKKFNIGRTVVTLEPVVIIDDTVEIIYQEGINMKFGDDLHSVLLTLDEITSLLGMLDSLNIELLSVQLYQMYLQEGCKTHNMTLEGGNTDT